MPNKKGTVICFANNKGGVGKTTSCASLGYLLTRKGHSVLFIDSDPQGNLSSRFGFDNRQGNTLGSLIKNRRNEEGKNQPLDDYIYQCEGFPEISIIISDLRLDAEYVSLSADNINSTTIFRDIVNEIRGLDRFDYILIDTRPALANEVASAFIAADHILIPIEAGQDSIVGANNMVAFAAKCRKLNPGLNVLGVFFNRISNRTKAFQEMLPMVKGNWESILFETVIPQNQDAVNAENFAMPLPHKFPNSKAAKAYKQLLDEVVSRIGD